MVDNEIVRWCDQESLPAWCEDLFLARCSWCLQQPLCLRTGNGNGEYGLGRAEWNLGIDIAWKRAWGERKGRGKGGERAEERGRKGEISVHKMCRSFRIGLASPVGSMFICRCY
jgi:hypothetical protein